MIRLGNGHRLALLAASVGLALVAASPGDDALAAPLSNTAGEQKNPAEQAYSDGRKALAAGRLDAAEKAFAEARRLSPRLVGAILGLAEVARQRGDAARFEPLLREALEIAPDAVDVQTTWAKYLYSRGQFDDARKALQTAIAAIPDAALLHAELGVVYAEGLRDDEAARRSFAEAVRLMPQMAAARFGLGNTLARLGKADEAEAELREAARLEPGNPLPRRALGRLQVARGDDLLRQGQREKAVEAYAAAIASDPRSAVPQVRLGMLHQSRGAWQQAEQAYLKAVALDPRNLIAYNNLAAMATARKVDLDRALQWAGKAVELAPGAANPLDTLAWVQRARGYLAGAAATLEKAMRAKDANALVAYHLGVVYDEQKRPRDAVAAYKKALAMDARFPGAEQATARIEALRQP